MQDEVNEKVVVLVINIGKKGIRLSASLLKTAMQKYLQFLFRIPSTIWSFRLLPHLRPAEPSSVLNISEGRTEKMQTVPQNR